ncbi:MAG: hypothetical protein NZV14_04315 [Bryobacteraceae bacterium]|nr:hypothetical protein [Bryobacteraceae bacterium]MDW8377357.1 hypothetical protein [Bryobacterales bacterium]
MNIYGAGLEGLHRAEAKLQQSAARLAQVTTSPANFQDVVDLSNEAVALLLAETSFKANLESIETAAELDKTIIDLIG